MFIWTSLGSLRGMSTPGASCCKAEGQETQDAFFNCVRESQTLFCCAIPLVFRSQMSLSFSATSFSCPFVFSCVISIDYSCVYWEKTERSGSTPSCPVIPSCTFLFSHVTSTFHCELLKEGMEVLFICISPELWIALGL